MSAPSPLLARLSILPLVLLLVAVIAYGGFGLGRDRTVKTHSLRNAEACLACHVSYEDYGLRAPAPDLCGTCHPWEALSPRQEHAPGDPDAEACTRCHDPHGKTRGEHLLWPEIAGS